MVAIVVIVIFIVIVSALYHPNTALLLAVNIMNLTTIYQNSEKPDVAVIAFTYPIYAINLIGGVGFSTSLPTLWTLKC